MHLNSTPGLLKLSIIGNIVEQKYLSNSILSVCSGIYAVFITLVCTGAFYRRKMGDLRLNEC